MLTIRRVVAISAPLLIVGAVLAQSRPSPQAEAVRALLTLGYHLEVSEADYAEAATAAEKLIVKDKVPVIVGAWGSSMTLAAMPKLEEYGVPMIDEDSKPITTPRS